MVSLDTFPYLSHLIIELHLVNPLFVEDDDSSENDQDSKEQLLQKRVNACSAFANTILTFLDEKSKGQDWKVQDFKKAFSEVTNSGKNNKSTVALRVKSLRDFCGSLKDGARCRELLGGFGVDDFSKPVRRFLFKSLLFRD